MIAQVSFEYGFRYRHRLRPGDKGPILKRVLGPSRTERRDDVLMRTGVGCNDAGHRCRIRCDWITNAKTVSGTSVFFIYLFFL